MYGVFKKSVGEQEDKACNTEVRCLLKNEPEDIGVQKRWLYLK
jgi:hypothetical protein